MTNLKLAPTRNNAHQVLELTFTVQNTEEALQVVFRQKNVLQNGGKHSVRKDGSWFFQSKCLRRAPLLIREA